MGAIKIGCIYAPDHRQHCQEALKRLFGDAGGVWGFLDWSFVSRGGCGLLIFVPGVAIGMGGLKGQNIRGVVFDHPHVLVLPGILGWWG